jgi:dipeptidyl aminopeptidase/acylaminoacyl peptidase
VMNADGSGQTRLTNNAASDTKPSWSPDGHRILFQSDRDGNSEVYVMNGDGSGQTNLTNNPHSDGSAVWSPDGTKILFVTDRDVDQEVYVMDANGGNPTNLTNNPTADFDPDWPPDGSKILFIRRTDPTSLPADEVYVMPSGGGTAQRFTTEGGGLRFCSKPVWSPDGSKVVYGLRYLTYNIEDITGDTHEIVSRNSDGTGRTVLSDVTPHVFNDDYLGSWQPRPHVVNAIGGDGQLFGLDRFGQVWRYGGSDNTWTALSGWGVQLVVASTGDSDPVNDVVFLRASDNRIWEWNQSGWSFTGGWLPGLVAGDNQLFGVGFDGQVWQFNIVSGWTKSGGYGASIDVGNVGDANPSNDIVFLLSADSRLWTWDQHAWKFTGGWLPSVTAGDNQAFAIGYDGQLWRYRVAGANAGWTKSGGWGAAITLANTGDGDPSNDIVFLHSVDQRVWMWTQNTWTFTGGWLKSLTGADNQLFGLDGSGRVYRYRASGAGAGWTFLDAYGVDLAVGSSGNEQPDDDLVFLTASSGALWVRSQSGWTNTGQ